ncbi:metal-dependent transcriptional regulator [Hydrogenovibrio thermophilus]|uniref:Transcriptional regulator MntR n=1 Tax=Hydrogenovibrio thermophilus TaxID=265883 RepID=A0A410H2G3_9GAMM|nr:metal-dependent transcriptional regulator [Hydrogenovibrio thermophilus]QAB15086.1 metal-dependent transcriptional regulator [Hydrogenovibrio thermophilus]
MASKALEDYLKIIYKLEEANETDKGVSTSAIAERLAISQASVSNMLKKLADKALIRYEPYYGVALSDAGRKVALSMIRKHRILELFLVERLGYQWDEVDEEAEVLEHAISDKLTNRMWEELGRPTEDPHGSPIPDESGEMIEQAAIGLSQADLETTLEVIRIQNRSPEELRYLFSIGLVKGAKVRVLQKAPFDGPISIEIAGTQHPLDFRLAESIFVA